MSWQEAENKKKQKLDVLMWQLRNSNQCIVSITKLAVDFTPLTHTVQDLYSNLITKLFIRVSVRFTSLKTKNEDTIYDMKVQWNFFDLSKREHICLISYLPTKPINIYAYTYNFRLYGFNLFWRFSMSKDVSERIIGFVDFQQTV